MKALKSYRHIIITSSSYIDQWLQARHVHYELLMNHALSISIELVNKVLGKALEASGLRKSPLPPTWCPTRKLREGRIPLYDTKTISLLLRFVADMPLR